MRLSIDLSNQAGSLCLHKESLLIGALSLDGKNRHSELLLDELQKFLTLYSVEPRQLTEIVSSLGPGSFTGLRIAVSTVKAFSVAWKIPFFLVNGSEARGRAYQKRFPENKNGITILTRVASKTYSKAVLSATGSFLEDVTIELEGPVLQSNTTILVDSEETKALLPIPSVVFPIQAEYLAEQLESCTSKLECLTFEDLVRASPNYYGSSRF